jgi:hypothetical protein
VNAVFYGPIEQALLYLQPIKAISPLLLSEISIVPWNKELNAAFFGLANSGCIRGNYVNIYSLALKQTNVPTWETHFADLADFYVQNPWYQGRLLAERYPNQAALAVPGSRTAYPYREAKIQLYVTVPL